MANRGNDQIDLLRSYADMIDDSPYSCEEGIMRVHNPLGFAGRARCKGHLNQIVRGTGARGNS